MLVRRVKPQGHADRLRDSSAIGGERGGDGRIDSAGDGNNGQHGPVTIATAALRPLVYDVPPSGPGWTNSGCGATSCLGAWLFAGIQKATFAPEK